MTDRLEDDLGTSQKSSSFDGAAAKRAGQDVIMRTRRFFARREIIVRDQVGQEQHIELKTGDQIGGLVALTASAAAVVVLAGTVILQTRELNNREQELADVVQAYSELADQIVEAEDRLAGHAEELATRHELLTGIITNLDAEGTPFQSLDEFRDTATGGPESRSMGGPQGQTEAPAPLMLAPGIPYPTPNPLREAADGRQSSHLNTGQTGRNLVAALKDANTKPIQLGQAAASIPPSEARELSATELDLPVSKKWAVAVISPLTAVIAPREAISHDSRDIHYKLAATPVWLRESKERVAGMLARIDDAQSTIALALGGAARKEINRIEDVYATLNLTAPTLAADENISGGFAMGGPFIGLTDQEPGSAIAPASADDSDAVFYDEEIGQAALELRRLEALRQSVDQLPLDMPVKQKAFWFSSRYGTRRDPINNRWAHHSGLDFAGRHRTPVFAPAAGTVVLAKPKGAYGKVVEIDHGNGIKTRYGHLNAMLVQRGNKVARGQQIALMGSTGRSTGPHLHYEIWVNGQTRDPMTFLKAGSELNGTIVADANGRN